MFKTKKALALALILLSVAILDVSAFSNADDNSIDYSLMESDGTINGKVVDWDLYELAYPDINAQCDSPDFPTMRSIVEAHDKFWENKK